MYKRIIRAKQYALIAFSFIVVILLVSQNLRNSGEPINDEASSISYQLSASNVNYTVLSNQFCGYQSCPKTKPGLVNVHLIAHSHDDIGWLSTADEYYSGSINSIHNVSVAKIIDSVVDQLLLDPSRRFIYAEMAFFQRWWDQQKEDRRDVVRDLVANGRLEFINGGWCMNDEGSTHYVDIIDQMSLGLDFLNKTFGDCGRPKVAWQIDPFGHSREHASLMAQMGFDGMFLGRIDYQDKNKRLTNKTMEMIWSGADGEIFTGILYDLYTAPAGFCFDEKSHAGCHDPGFSESDIEKRVSSFLDFANRQSNSFRTNNIMITMGHDFTYQTASTWFTPMDKLIKHANQRQVNGSRFNLFYSTPACYLKALNDEHHKAAADNKTAWPKKTDDFFPYGSEDYQYWTGYFTSRPTLKYMIRQGSNLLQSCKQMALLLKGKGVNYNGDISVMKKAMGTMQHHDAVTGTEKQYVADDYVRILHKGVEECQTIQNSFYRKMLPKTSKIDLEVSFCQLNMSQCYLTENTDQFIVNVYNPLARTVDKYVRIPVNNRKQASAFQVLDSNGKSVLSELVPLPELVKNLPGRMSQATHELVFLASQLPPLGSRSFHIATSITIDNEFSATRELKNKIKNTSTATDQIISNGKIGIKIDGLSGLMKSIISADGKENRLEQEFLWYPSNNGSDGKHRRASDCYLFRPSKLDAIPIKKSKGELVQEVHQYHNEWIGQVIRLYKGVDHVEFDWVVGPIPIEDGLGKELIARFKTDLASGDTFFTDSNGRQTMKRRIDWRETFDYKVSEPVAGNYYPVNSHIYISDSVANKKLTVLVDRPQGGSSLKEGQLELMLHRRLTDMDPIYGFGEVLDEVAHGRGLVVRGTHYLTFSDDVKSSKLVTSLKQDLYKQPQVSFYETQFPFEKWSKLYNTEVKLLNRDLPENVNILTLEPRSDGDFLLRLENSFDDSDDQQKVLSHSTAVPLKGLFNGLSITSIQEAMLGGNEWKKNSQRLVWTDTTSNHKLLDANLTITLSPMQIRTFILTLISEN